MPMPKTNPELVGQIKCFLEQKWSYRVIINYFKKKKISVSLKLISKIKNNSENDNNLINKSLNYGRKSLLSKPQLRRLKEMVIKPNPPTQKSMGKKLGVSQQVISYQINKKLKYKKVVKPKGHELTPKMQLKRYQRAWPLYHRLKHNRWENVITTDEAWFYLTNFHRKTKIQYISRDKTRASCDKFTSLSHPKGVMVWAGISSHGVTKMRFVEPGAKINSSYYIEKILEPFIKEDIPKLYPNNNYIFHQDSAPSHSSKKTLKFLNDNRIPFIKPQDWMPNSPDVAPCDYFLWGYLKSKVNSHKVTTINGLKKVIKSEFAKIPQEMINRALKSWPKRCRFVYYNKGSHIEKNN